MTDLVGQKVAHYRLDAIVGDGGMGSVYKAHDLNLERTVAVKVMHTHFARLEEFRARLAQEARIAAQLDHPSIVRIFDFGEFNGGLYIAMEYIAGGNLRSHLHRLQTRRRMLPLKQSIQIAMQIADALDYAHGKGVIHRDVKPSNIILKQQKSNEGSQEPPFRAVLTDFGLVKLLEGNAMTESGKTLGTPTYMSPEQCEGLLLDGRSDLYSLGVVLYELVTNQLPFKFKSLSEAMASHMRGLMPVPPREVKPDLPPMIDNILARSLAKMPEDRFSSGQDMYQALKSALLALEEDATRVMDTPVGVELVASDVQQYRLRIETPGREPSYAKLSRATVVIGRGPENDIVLPSEGVSRSHLKVLSTEIGWVVIDQGGVNGSWLDQKRLRPNKEYRLYPGAVLEVGPYRLVVEGPDTGQVPVLFPVRGVEDDERTASRDSGITPVESLDILPLALFLTRESVSAEPGRQAEMKVEVANNSAMDDRVRVRIRGLPADWIVLPDAFVKVPAGDSVTIPIRLRPPKSPEVSPGRHRFRIELVSQRHQGKEPAKSATLHVTTFESYKLSLESRQIQLPGIARLQLQNVGNIPGTYGVSGQEDEAAIQIRGAKSQIKLQPGQKAVIELELAAKRQPWFGSSQEVDFKIEVVSSAGLRQSVKGKAQIVPLLPTYVAYLALFLIVFLCALSAFFLVFQRNRLLPPAVATTPVQGGNIATATAQSLTSTAGASATFIAATEAAATAAALGDRDGDGLSDAQEEIVGTDPDNPDTDADGLLDGEEVLTWGTNPLSRDTDVDVLLDGDEVKVHGTDPTNPDTDGDTFSDGLEIAMGTDPLDPNDPPPTATATIAVPTNTPTQPLPTGTATATLMPSETPTLTPTPTATGTPPPTDTPTITPSPTVTEIPTEVPAPNPVVMCLAQPPLIDGVITVTEWGGAPTIVYAPDDDLTRQVQIYLGRNGGQFYSAVIINDPTNEPATDSARLYFDANGNAGDPDSADRFFQVVRDGTLTARAGIGMNNDGQEWDAGYSSDQWEAMPGEPGGNRWVFEMQVNMADVMPAISTTNPFGMMSLVLYTGSQGEWPTDAITNLLNTWQDIDNMDCG